MDLRDLLKEYWPIVAGVFAVLVTAIVLWPSGKPNSPTIVGPEQRTLLPDDFKELTREMSEPDVSENDASKDAFVLDRAEKSKPPEPDPSSMEMLEIVHAVPLEGKQGSPQTFTTDDPEVQKALAQVKVVFYEENDCESCDLARRLLEANGVPLSVIDVDEDSNQRERARRLSGKRSFPVVVVDGKVLTDVSEKALQGALTAAVKQRVAARK